MSGHIIIGTKRYDLPTVLYCDWQDLPTTAVLLALSQHAAQSARDVMDSTGLSHHTVHRVLDDLFRRNYLTRGRVLGDARIMGYGLLPKGVQQTNKASRNAVELDPAKISAVAFGVSS